jgi:hypothetical protein
MGDPDVTNVFLLLLAIYYRAFSHLRPMRYSSQASVRSVLAVFPGQAEIEDEVVLGRVACPTNSPRARSAA